MKKWIYRSFIAIILLLSLVLSLGLCFAGPGAAGANEQLSAPPALRTGDGRLNDDFLADAARWVGDHFYLRQNLISIGNWISAHVFHTSGNDSVILGRGQWLYYASTLDDYTGQNGMTEQELYAAAQNLQLMADYCRSQGRNFAFMIAPNKNSLYGEHMPNYGAVSEMHDGEKLLAMLREQDVPVIDLFSAFREQAEVLYYATDSHWNRKGAALGADLINKAFGKETSYFTGPFTPQGGYTGDLYHMHYPAFSGNDADPQYGKPLNFTFRGKGNQPDSITLLTSGRGSGSLLAYRDSFGNVLFPYLADSYESARFSRSTAYNLTLNADHVLIELVERNLRYLITNLPVMPAPEAELAVPESSSGAAGISVDSRAGKLKGYTPWKGTVPHAIGEDSNVYVIAGNQAFRAFLMQDGGYCAYLPAEAEPVSLAIQSGEAIERFDFNTSKG